MNKCRYIVPLSEILNVEDLMQEEGLKTSQPVEFGDAKKNQNWFMEEGAEAPQPVGGTAGTGKSALELPTQNRKIWSD